jgi:hypothetical protein
MKEFPIGSVSQFSPNSDAHHRMASNLTSGNAMAIAANAAYSTDLALSDFCLLGHVKTLLRGESFETGAIFIGSRGNLWVRRKMDFDMGFSRADEDARAIS